jgi:hypothetical protein
VAIAFRYLSDTEALRGGMDEADRRLRNAGRKAVKQAATLAVDLARRDISRNNSFSRRWTKAMQFRMTRTPPGQFAEAVVFHAIPFAILFEEGGTIRGKPKLWLPIEGNLPPGRWTPRLYVKRFGPLVSVNHPGKPPLLFAKALPKKRDAASIKRLAALGGKTDVRKPLFVGVDSSTIRKRFNIYAAIQTAVDRMGGLFEDALAQEK